MEWKFFDGESPEFASKEWYRDIPSAHHVDEAAHRERLVIASEFVLDAVRLGGRTVVDLGCGDGGLLELLKGHGINAWGYDLMPQNINYATMIRKVDARYTDFTGDDIEYGDIAIMTETLEHMEDPHKVVRDLPSEFIVASSPYNENPSSHYEFHLWAWDEEGYDNLIKQGGYTILKKAKCSGWSQLILAKRL